MNNFSKFETKLKMGSRLEEAVFKKLLEVLPDCDVRLTPQGMDEPERMKYNLVDVMVFKDDKPWFGIECKYGETPYRICEEKNGWSADYNCPLNTSTLNHYADAKFPVFILNLQSWTREIQAARVSDIIKQNYESRAVVYKDTTIRNYNTSNWIRSGSIKWVLDQILDCIK